MGNYKFRFSEMIPNAWFYKLKDFNSKKSHKIHPRKKSPPPPPPSPSPTPPQSLHKTKQPLTDEPIGSRKSYYYARKQMNQVDPQNPDELFTDPPRRSSRKRPNKSKVALNAQFRPQVSPDPSEDRVPCLCKLDPPMLISDDVIISFNDSKTHDRNRESSTGFESESRIIELASINTRPEKAGAKEGSCNNREQQRLKKVTVSSPANGIRLRVNSPRIIGHNAGRRSSFSGSGRRKSISESFAIVKSSKDPQRDFKDSMVEMIRENDIKGSKELEELLACYLELNSDEYHDVIIKVFKQVWFDLNGANATKRCNAVLAKD
ncbi:hypothetical protein Droror1_Dr00008998 [Drosera rotundifolia]